MTTRLSRKGFPSPANSAIESGEGAPNLEQTAAARRDLADSGKISLTAQDLSLTDGDAIVSPQELQDLVDRFGEDMTVWPTEVRAPAEELLDASVEARGIIAQARRLRQQLRNLGPKAPHCIVDRIVSIALDTDPPLDDVCRLRN